MMSAASTRENVIVVRVGFEAYATLVDGMADTASPRVAYDGEALELMSPSKDHERYNRLLEGLVTLLGDEWGVRISTTGSMTLQAKPHGAEPDSSFYVDNAAFRLAAADLDFAIDPPPDIVVEIDMSRSRIDKRPIYAAFGVREFWRFDGERLRAYRLRDEAYVETAQSTVIDGLPLAALAEFLDMRNALPEYDIRRAWQSWLRAHKPASRD